MNGLSSLRCVVLGGGGFIGTNLCMNLAGRVDALSAFGRRQSFPEVLKGIDWKPGCFSDPSSLAAAVAGCDVVFHLIATTTPASANADILADLQANVAGTLRLLDVCRAERVRRVVFISSGGTVYGIPQQIPTPETAACAPITAYGISKLAIERYLALYEHLYGVEYRVLRVANPYGPFQVASKNQGVVAAFLRRALAGKPIEMWGDGSVVRDYLYIDDVVSALELAALHDGPERVFNIGSGQGHSLLDLLAEIEQVLGKKIPVHQHQGRAVDVPSSILDIQLAMTELGWVPRTSFMDGLRRTVAWFEKMF